eukprot:scaffold129858_cov27-Tisochrysis_lutea.AAC.4
MQPHRPSASSLGGGLGPMRARASAHCPPPPHPGRELELFPHLPPLDQRRRCTWSLLLRHFSMTLDENFCRDSSANPPRNALTMAVLPKGSTTSSAALRTTSAMIRSRLGASAWSRQRCSTQQPWRCDAIERQSSVTWS